MSKDAYYFSHDSNAHKDPKILKLRAKFGWEGYGVFWAVIETLREQKDYRWKADEKELLSFSFSNGEPVVNQIIDYCIDIGLLKVTDDGFIQSESLNKRMRIREEKRKKKVEAGRKGAQARWSNSGDDGSANGDANDNLITEDGKGKERKGKEIESKGNISPPPDVTNEEKKMLSILANVKDYPFDYQKDLDYIRKLTVEYPDLDMHEQLKAWSTHKLDKPLQANSNPRSQIRTWCQKSKQWGKGKKKTPQRAANGYWDRW